MWPDDRGRKRGRDHNADFDPFGHILAQRPRLLCARAAEAREFLQTLGVDDAFLDSTFDRCYCSTCALALPKVMRVADAYTYELPVGFCGFGIKMPPRAQSLQIFDKWAVSFHGIKAANVASVLNEGGLLLPGDQLLDGTTLRATHTRDEDRQRLYTSPSVLYSEKPVYTEPIIFRGSCAKVVLQCRQLPDFEVCGETIGWERQHPGVPISPHFPNSEIEWYTRRRNAIVPYRILIKLQEPRVIVAWSGMSHHTSTEKKDIAKCRSSEFLRPSDVVKAITPIHFGTAIVDQGALGAIDAIVTTQGNLTVDWYGIIGKVDTPRTHIRKCEPSEFFRVNDVVQALVPLNYENGNVERNGLGTLVEVLNAAGQHVVKWPFGNALVCRSQIRKADSCEFWSEGDVVKSTRDLDYSSDSNGGAARLIKNGSLGILTSNVGDPVIVDWSPHALGKTQVRRADLSKCEPLEHLTGGDVVRAVRDLTFTVDGQQEKVYSGGFGKLIEVQHGMQA